MSQGKSSISIRAMASMAMSNNQSNLVGGMEHEWKIFPYAGNNYPN